jgi:8-oxo-dGTP diphosphatase
MDQIIKKFGNRVRMRVCALIYDKDRLLLVRHQGLGQESELWAPPGGGVDFGEPAIEALKREVKEETGLTVVKAEFQFINEFIAPPLHAIELFFHVSQVKGALKKGYDPEMADDQIIKEVQYMAITDVKKMKDSKKHNILQGNITINSLQALNKYHKFSPSY